MVRLLLLLLPMAAWGQPSAFESAGVSMDLVAYLDLKADQLEAIGRLKIEDSAYARGKSARSSELYREIQTWLAASPLDPNEIGIRYAEIVAINHDISENTKQAQAEMQAVLSPAQRSKLTAASEARALAVLRDAAQCQGMFPPPSDSPAEFLPRILGSRPSTFSNSQCYFVASRPGDGPVVQPTRLIPPELVSYLSLSPGELTTIATLGSEQGRFEVEASDKAKALRKELDYWTVQSPIDSGQLGDRYSAIEALRREVVDRGDGTTRQIQNLLRDRTAKLGALDSAMKLAEFANSAVCADLLPPSRYPAPEFGPGLAKPDFSCSRQFGLISQILTTPRRGNTGDFPTGVSSPAITRIPAELAQVMAFTPNQIDAIRGLEVAQRRFENEKRSRIGDVSIELSDLRNRLPADPYELGIRLAEIEAIQRDIRDKQKRMEEKIQALLTTSQRTKLTSLTEALKLTSHAEQAECRRILSRLPQPPLPFFPDFAADSSLPRPLNTGVYGCYIESPPTLAQFLDLVPGQELALDGLNATQADLEVGKLSRAFEVQTEIDDWIAQTPIDSRQIGIRYAEIEAIERDIENSLRRVMEQIRALMTPIQLTRITALDAGRRMARLAADAACADLLAAAFYPIEGDSLTTASRGGYFPPGCVDLFRFEYIVPADRTP